MRKATTILVFCVAALLGLGMVVLYSIGIAEVGPGHRAAHFLPNQALWCAIGLVAALAIVAIDYRMLKRLAWPLFLTAVVLLVLVLIPQIGRKSHGARRWFSVAGVNLQPSEFAKIALLIFLAWYGERYQRQMREFKRGLLYPGLAITAVLGLLFVEPDRGTTALMAVVTGSLLVLAGTRLWYFIPPAALGAAAFVFALIHDPLRMRRLFSWLNPEATKEGIGYQAYQAKLALGAGGFGGLGLGNGRQKLGFVPERQTDFIFSIIGEELGYMTTVAVIVLFVAFVICGLYIAWKAKDTFGMLLAASVTTLIGLQAFVNIGVVSGALPNKGLALPFISYGGSSLVTMLACVGILLSVARQCDDSPSESGPNGSNPFSAAQSS